MNRAFSRCCALWFWISASAFGDVIEVPLIVSTNDVVFTNLAAGMFSLPPSPVESVALSSPSTLTNFSAINDNNTYAPPDTMGAVGPDHLMVMINGQVRIQDRAGTTITETSLNAWWNSVGPFSDNATNFVFDPRVIYDPYSGRWIAVAVCNRAAANAGVLLAASATADPTGTWYFYNFAADATGLNWADFPLVGFSRNKVVVSWAYVQTSTGTLNGSAVVAFDKATLYAGNHFTTGSTLTFINVPASSGYHFMPAATYDTNQPTVYLVQTASSTRLAVYSVSGAAGSAAFTFRGNASAPAWHRGGQLNFGRQLGTSQQINLLDDRMGSQVVYREGSLWCAHTIWLPSSSPTRAAIQWWQLNTNGASIQRAYVQDATAKTNYAYPSIAVNKFRDVLIGFSSFATNQYASANYAFRASDDSIGTFQAPVLLKAGLSSFWKLDGSGRNRWGDYSASQVDPVNDIDLWTIQEYAGQRVGTLTNGSGRFGLWWGSVAPVLPANDVFANSYVITGAEGSTNGTNLRATREAGEPNHAGHTNSPSVWYHWVAPTNGATTVTATNQARLDTAIAIYTGSSVAGLTLITNRHAVGGTNVVFTATAGVTYRIAVAGYNGSCGNFTLGWAAPLTPIILEQPQSTNCVADVNENANFSVGAIGSPAPAYQWRFQGTNTGAATTSIPGATNATYTINNVQTNHAGNYSVVVTNSAGSVTSSVAALFIHADSAARLNLYGSTTTSFWFQVYGLTNRPYVVETSTNLNSSTNWYPVFTNFVSFFYTNFNGTSDAQRFYRSVTNN